LRTKYKRRYGYVAQCFTGWLINALCVPSFVLLYPVTHFHNRRMPLALLPTPIDFVEQNPFAVITNPVASDPVQLAPISEQFVRQIRALVAILIAILITTPTVSARRFSFAFATSAHSLPFWFWL
jgi:hypothetical protein